MRSGASRGSSRDLIFISLTRQPSLVMGSHLSSRPCLCEVHGLCLGLNPGPRCHCQSLRRSYHGLPFQGPRRPPPGPPTAPASSAIWCFYREVPSFLIKAVISILNPGDSRHRPGWAFAPWPVSVFWEHPFLLKSLPGICPWSRVASGDTESSLLQLKGGP